MRLFLLVAMALLVSASWAEDGAAEPMIVSIYDEMEQIDLAADVMRGGPVLDWADDPDYPDMPMLKAVAQMRGAFGRIAAADLTGKDPGLVKSFKEAAELSVLLEAALKKPAKDVTRINELWRLQRASCNDCHDAYRD